MFGVTRPLPPFVVTPGSPAHVVVGVSHLRVALDFEIMGGCFIVSGELTIGFHKIPLGPEIIFCIFPICRPLPISQAAIQTSAGDESTVWNVTMHNLDVTEPANLRVLVFANQVEVIPPDATCVAFQSMNLTTGTQRPFEYPLAIGVQMRDPNDQSKMPVPPLYSSLGEGFVFSYRAPQEGQVVPAGPTPGSPTQITVTYEQKSEFDPIVQMTLTKQTQTAQGLEDVPCVVSDLRPSNQGQLQVFPALYFGWDSPDEVQQGPKRGPLKARIRKARVQIKQQKP
eukprot:TRINITY_DN1116_c0_g1_i1.p1 TRINITY_DN1116_c0_g1~~TRINITY_DN1116_c0_g1_i1.p1  ORF type:complete len:283 (-),score=50.13 TRINITY_DN1116_c0_g1_i1:250-1098(-)